MATTTVVRNVNAPVDLVFDAVASIENYSKIIDGIVDVEYLTEKRVGVGTRFRETRKMGKREASTELEVTEYKPHARVRMVADQGGTIWDTVFTARPAGDGGVELKMVMDANAYKLAAKLMNPLIRGMITRAIESDMDAVKAHCERVASETA